MEINVIKKDEKTYIFDEGGVRYFLLTGDNESLLIDSGMKSENVKELVLKYTDKKVNLINTHCDGDHTACNKEFDEVYLHPSELTNYKKPEGQKIVPVWHKSIIDLGNRPIEILHIPGHTEGSIALLDINSRVLISGDSIQKNGRVFMFGGHRNMDGEKMSLERLKEETDRFDEIWPSHAECPLPPEAVDYCLKDIESLNNGQLEIEGVEMFGNKVRLAKGSYTDFLI